MPCRDYEIPSHTVYKTPPEVKKVLDRQARILCKVLTQLEKEGTVDNYLTVEGKEWWEQHKKDNAQLMWVYAEAEAKRKETARKKKERAEAKARAIEIRDTKPLGQLTKEDKALLKRFKLLK